MRNYTVKTKINRSVSEVFNAVVDPELICKYFAERTDGGLIEGNRVTWFWQDWGEYPVNVISVDQNRLVKIAFDTKDWKKTGEDEIACTITAELEFESINEGSSNLTISESGWGTDDAGLKGSHENCSGWTHFAMCLKGYVEHGLNLRE